MVINMDKDYLDDCAGCRGFLCSCQCSVIAVLFIMSCMYVQF